MRCETLLSIQELSAAQRARLRNNGRRFRYFFVSRVAFLSVECGKNTCVDGGERKGSCTTNWRYEESRRCGHGPGDAENIIVVSLSFLSLLLPVLRNSLFSGHANNKKPFLSCGKIVDERGCHFAVATTAEEKKLFLKHPPIPVLTCCNTRETARKIPERFFWRGLFSHANRDKDSRTREILRHGA